MHTFIAEYNCYPTWIISSNTALPGRWWGEQLERAGYAIANPATDFNQKGIWRCPSAQASEGSITFYGYNAFGVLPVGNLSTNFGLGGLRSPDSSRFMPIGEAEVIAPAEMMAIGESDKFAFIRNLDYDFYHRALRHQNKVNVVFCDGHVESPTLQFLFEGTGDAALAHWNRDHQPHREGL